MAIAKASAAHEHHTGNTGPPGPNPGTAAVLSFLLPGLGLIYCGRIVTGYLTLVLFAGIGSAAAALLTSDAVDSGTLALVPAVLLVAHGLQVAWTYGQAEQG